MYGNEEAADALAEVIRKLQPQLGRPVRVLEIGAGGNVPPEIMLRRLIGELGVKPSSLEYHYQDLDKQPVLGQKFGVAVRRLPAADAATKEGLAALRKNGPYDVVLTVNVKTLAGAAEDPFSRDKNAEASAKKAVAGMHANSYELLHPHGIMLDIFHHDEECDYTPPSKHQWIHEEPERIGEYSIRAYRKKAARL